VSSAEEESYHQGTASMSTARALERDDAFTPASPERSTTVTEPARETPVYAETEVLVVGGGPAGCAAALAARRAGAEVLLVERYNHLGGLSTGGLVIWIDRMTDWSGRPVITGIGQELLDRLPAAAVAGAPRSMWGSTEADDVAY
jgi:NADPH-dependent 2,4-dienoyl-CoA reductase/sulfur reductase-like enzyme